MAILTTGDVAARLGVHTWHITRAIDRGFISPAGKVGSYRVFTEADLPKVEDGLRKAGYLDREAGALAATA